MTNANGSAPVLPGLDVPAPIGADLTKATEVTVRARREAGLIDDLDAALVALILADAAKLDASVAVGRPSGRAKLLQAMSDAIEALPAPTFDTGGVLASYLSALLGTDEDAPLSDAGAALLPIVDPPGDSAGVQERGVRVTLRARHAAGLSTVHTAVHEQLALMAAQDLDRAQGVGRPSGFALLASVMQTIIERLPRPEAVADGDMVDRLLASAIDPTPSPFHALPTPAHHPERDESWSTEGHEIAAVARAMGRHLMPWQRRALDVATEYRVDEHGHRRYRYSSVLVTVPRQSGKTDLTIPLQLHRALTRDVPASVWYTAQSGQDARKRIMELIERVEGSPLTELFTSTRSNGAEGVRVREQPGSHVTRFSPTFSALHGEHPPLVTLDEIWHFGKDLGDALLGAIEPGQITLGSRAQTWMVSTMGTVNSEWMNEIVDRGRAGSDPDLCYIEYSCPDDLDPLDPTAWPQFHPAVGNTIGVEDLAKRARAAADDPARRATFLRAYANRLVSSDGSLFDLAVWDDLAMEVDPPAPNTAAFAIEVAPANAAAAVVAAWTDPLTERPAVRIVHQAPGTDWLVPFVLRTLPEQLGYAPRLAADGAGPVARFVARLTDQGHTVRTLSMSEFGQACEALIAAAGTDETLIHDGSDELRAQAAAVEVRTSNGVRRFSRDSPRPVPALIAAAIALHAHEHPEHEGFSGVL